MASFAVKLMVIVSLKLATSTRASLFALSESFAKSRLGFYKKKKTQIFFKKLSDLSPYRIGVVRGYVNTKEFDQAKFLIKDFAKSDKANLKKLLKGRLDLIIVDHVTAQFILNSSFPNEKEFLEFLEPPLEEKGLHLALSRKNLNFEEILKGFAEGLKSIVKDGTKDKIINKHNLK